MLKKKYSHNNCCKISEYKKFKLLKCFNLGRYSSNFTENKNLHHYSIDLGSIFKYALLIHNQEPLVNTCTRNFFYIHLLLITWKLEDY